MLWIVAGSLMNESLALMVTGSVSVHGWNQFSPIRLKCFLSRGTWPKFLSSPILLSIKRDDRWSIFVSVKLDLTQRLARVHTRGAGFILLSNVGFMLSSNVILVWGIFEYDWTRLTWTLINKQKKVTTISWRTLMLVTVKEKKQEGRFQSRLYNLGF